MEMNLQKYLSFVKAAEYGSFTRAAEVLHYSQSCVSRMIADLESEWHMTLLERGKGGVTLTSEGLALRDRTHTSLAVTRFLEYLEYRNM